MDTKDAELSSRLTELDEHIAAKRREIERDGPLHAHARKHAADLKIKSARLAALEKAIESGASHPQRRAAFAGQIEALRVSVDRMLANLDLKV